jgi:hypothetical protein
MGDPHAEYTNRIAARRAAVARLVRREERNFDYRVRPGVVTKSNALGLMRTVGLEV